MKKSSLFFLRVFILLIVATTSIYAQQKWTVDGKFIDYQGKPVFLNGVNYVPPINWMMMFENWDAKQAERDIAALKQAGVKCIRFFPLWHSIQPQPNKLNEQMLCRIDTFLALGIKYNIHFQYTLFTGWMSGGTFLPDWAVGNIYKDSAIIEGEKFMVSAIAKRYKNHPAIHGFDFGNEMNVLVEQMKLQVTPKEIASWMKIIYTEFKKYNPDVLITNGIGTGFDPYFNIEAIADACDYMSVHSYSYFHGTLQYDPQIGQRSLYSSNFIAEWAAMVGKPVLMQENGASSLSMPDFEVAKFLRVNYMSNWAEGAAGYFWWSSHCVTPNYIVTTPGLRKDYSVAKMVTGELGGDKYMGILNINNTLNTQGETYKLYSNIIQKLGTGWNDELPVCYIIVPHTTEFYETMRRFITPFTLAKQAHFDVKICWEDKPIPNDATCVIIPGFQLSNAGKANINSYLVNGGKVYQSYFNDLAPNIQFSGKQTFANQIILYPARQEGDLFGRTALQLSNVNLKEITSESVKDIAPYHILTSDYFEKKSQYVFVKTQVGKGDYYFLAADIEASIQQTYNPWANVDAHKLYNALKPKSDIYIDNKYIELYIKNRNSQRIMLLINHENTNQCVNIYSKDAIEIESIHSENAKKYKGKEINIKMNPAEILIFKISN